MAIHRIQGPDGRIHRIEAPEDARQEDLFAFVQQTIDEEKLRRLQKDYGPGILETGARAVARGFGQLGSTFTDIIPAAVGSALGFEDYAKENLKEAEEKRIAREAKYPTLFRSYKEIEGLGDFAKYATEAVGEQFANIATSLVPGIGVGSLVGRSALTGATKKLAAEAAEKGLAGEAAEQFVKQKISSEATRSLVGKATVRGQTAGAYLGSYALNAPEIFENIYEETQELAPGAAALFGSVAAALDAILPAQLARQIAGPTKAAIVGKVLEKSGMEKGLARSFTTGVLKGVAGEGLTEGAQEAISIAAERFVDDNPGVFGSKEWNRIVESAIKGAVAGGAFGGVGGGVKGLRERAEIKRQEAEEARVRGEEQLAQQREEEAKELEQKADAASAEIEKLQRPTTEAEQEAYGVAAETGPYSPVTPFGPITPKEASKQEAQFKKDQQELKARLAELTEVPTDLTALAERPSPIEQTLQKAASPLEQLQERGMRKGELSLEQMRQIGWKEEWNTLVPNIAELAQPEFRKALTSDVTIPVETRKGIIDAGKKVTLPDGKTAVPKSAKYSYPVDSSLMDDLRLRSKDVFGFSPSASVWKKLEGLDAKNPEHVPLIRSAFSEFAEKNPSRATKIEQYLDRLPPTPKLIEGAPSVTGTDEQAGREGVGVSGEGIAGAASETAGLAERRRVDTPTGYAGQPTRREIEEPSTLTPREQAAEAQFFGEEQVPIEERGLAIRRRKPTPEETKALETEGVEAAKTPTEPISNKTIKKLVKEFYSENYLDPDAHLYLPKYQGPAFDQTQARLAEAGDLNGLLRNLLDSNQDPAIKQVLRRIRSLNLKTKLEIGDPSTGVYFNQFYSALFRAVSQIPNKSATPEEWRGIIRGLVSKGTVKADEVFWTGLDDWLGTKKDVTNKLEKKELIDYLNSHGLFIDVNELSGDQTKYDGYDTPGGDNYREILPYLPEVPVIASNTVLRKEPDEKSEVLEKLPEGMFLLFDQEDSYLNNVQQFRLGKEAGVEWVKIIPLKETDKRDETGLEEGQPGWVRASDIRIHQELKFLTRHWPGLINPLGHIRINTRYDAEGNKILFVEEIQSDWAQQAKKTGFVSKEKFDATKEEIKKLVEEETKLRIEVDDSLQETRRLSTKLQHEARKESRTFYKYMTDKYGEGNPVLAMQMILHPEINPNWRSVSAALRDAAQDVPMYLLGNQSSDTYKNSTRYRDMFDVLTKIEEIGPRNWEGLSDSQKEALHFDVFTVLKRAMEEIPPAKEKTPEDFTTVYSRERTGALAAKTLADKFFATFFEGAFYAELEVANRERYTVSAFLPEEITKLQNKIRDNEQNEAIINDQIDGINALITEKEKEQRNLTLAGPYIGIPKRAVIVPITEQVTDIDARTGKPKPRTKEIGYRVNYGKDYYTFTRREDAEAQAAALDSRKEAAPSSEGWMNLALKQIALMAVREGYDKVAFIDWNRSHERFPIDREGNSTANLFSTLYGDTTGNQVNNDKPSLLKQGLQKLLNNWKGNPTLVRPNIGLSLRKGESRELTPNNAEVFVGKVLVEPYVGYTRSTFQEAPKIIFKKGHRLTLEDVNDIREHIIQEEERSASLVVQSDGFFDALGFDVTPAMQDKISQGLPYMYGKSGSYDPRSDTIILDPELGMNAHTFIHEVVHAAISNVLRNTSHPLTKEFESFFVSIKDRLGSAYGATDLQEFAAELMGNPSFQALLKSIKTPRSESLFMSILRKIAEFFGFAKETTAFTQGLKFIDAAIDVTNGVDAAPGEKLFFGMGDFSPIGVVGKAMPALVGRTVENTRNTLSNLGGGSFLEEVMGALRLDNLRDLFKKELPSIDTLQNVLERRVAREEADIKRVNENYLKFVEVQRKHPEQMRLMDDLSIRASQAEVDVTKPFERKPISPAKMTKMSLTQRNLYEMAERKREQDHNRLREEFLKINPEVRGVYETIRKDYDQAFHRYRQIIEKAAEDMPGLANKLREEFEASHPLIGYVPFLRRGDFWLEFTSPETDAPVVMAFETIRERDQFIQKELQGIAHRKFKRFEDIEYNADQIPSTHFISKVIEGLRKKKASQDQINSVYQAYLAAFPAESLAKQFMKRRGIEGMDKDLIRGYGDLMVRWVRKLNNSEFMPQIDRALSQIEQEGSEQTPDAAAAAGSILRQQAFFRNPSYGKWVSAGTALSYYEFMAGNISSGIINLTSLPLMVFPMLTGKFNPISAGSAILSAMKESLPGNNWQNDPKYKKLYDVLMEHGQLEHTMAREVLEGRRQKTGEYTGKMAKFTELVSLPFSVSEKWNRATTAIAAYNLEYARSKNQDKAIEYALDTVRTAHTSGMAATGSRWLQTPLGRLFGTFKSIIWQQAYVIARAFYQAAKDADPDVRKAARHQLLAMYGMATVFVGVKGMPFYGAMSVLAEMLNSMFGDEDEPFDFDEFMRDLLPMFLYKGLINYALNIEVANRAGLANDIIFRDDPRGIEQHGYVLSALQQAFGPVVSVAVNAERSVKLFKDGEYMRSFEASLPSALRNILKTTRYMQEGATTLDGKPIMEDISAYNGMMQLIGFAPADLSNRYEMIAAAKGFERQILDRRQSALRMFDMAVTSGDMELFSEAMERIEKFNAANPDYEITPDSLRRSQRGRRSAEKDTIYGIRFNKQLLPRIQQDFFEEE